MTEARFNQINRQPWNMDYPVRNCCVPILEYHAFYKVVMKVACHLDTTCLISSLQPCYHLISTVLLTRFHVTA